MDSLTARPMTVSGFKVTHGFRDCARNDRLWDLGRLTAVILRGAVRRLTAVILRGADRRSRLNPQLRVLAELSEFCVHGFRDCAPNDGVGVSR